MKSKNFLSILSLILLTFFAYANSLNNEFLNWDDGAYVVNNSYLRAISLDNIKHLLFDFYIGEWFPLQMLSYLIDYQIWGLNVTGYHITNLLFHTGSVVMIFLIFNSIGYKKSEAFVASALFAIFPPSVEAIAWISQRKSVMCMFFMLLSFHLYIKSFIYLSMFSFVASLLCKTTSIVMPGLIIFYEAVVRNEPILKSVMHGLKKASPFLFISIIFLLIFVYGQHTERIAKNYDFTVIWNAFFIFLISPFYWFTSKIFLPVNLNAFYPPVGYSTITSKKILISGLMWIIILLPIISFSLKNKLRLFWICAYFVCVIPGSIFAAVVLPSTLFETSSGGGDRHLYFLCLTFIGALWIGTAKVLKSKRQVLIPAIIFFISSYFILTVQRNFVWHNDLALWTDSIKKVPDYFLNQLKAGEAYMLQFYKTNNSDDLKSAIFHLKESVKQNRNIAKSHYNLAEALERQGNFEDALLHYEESNRLSRVKSPYPLRAQGRIYYNLKKYTEAINSYNQAIEIDPDSTVLWNEKGIIEMEKGLFDDAIHSFEKSLSINYNQYDIHRKLGALYLKKRDNTRALLYFDESLRLNPTQGDIVTLLKIVNELRKQVNK